MAGWQCIVPPSYCGEFVIITRCYIMVFVITASPPPVCMKIPSAATAPLEKPFDVLHLSVNLSLSFQVKFCKGGGRLHIISLSPPIIMVSMLITH